MNKILFFLLAIYATAFCVRAASLGGALLTVAADADVVLPESDVDLIRDRRTADAEPEPEPRGHHHHHQNLQHVLHHHYIHNEDVQSKPTSCYKCGGGGGGGGATFATASAGSVNTNNHGFGHFGSQSNSQAASYNFGPFSASFSSSQSTGGDGFGGLFF